MAQEYSVCILALILCMVLVLICIVRLSVTTMLCFTSVPDLVWYGGLTATVSDDEVWTWPIPVWCASIRYPSCEGLLSQALYKENTRSCIRWV